VTHHIDVAQRRCRRSPVSDIGTDDLDFVRVGIDGRPGIKETYLMTGECEHVDDARPDETGASCHEDGHAILNLL
jgi:hypothetical protein